MPVTRRGRAWLERGNYLADSHESARIYAEEELIHPRDVLRSWNFI